MTCYRGSRRSLQGVGGNFVDCALRALACGGRSAYRCGMTEPSEQADAIRAALHATLDAQRRLRVAPPRIDAQGLATVVVDIGGLAPDQRDALDADVRAAVLGVSGIRDIRIVHTAERGSATGRPAPTTEAAAGAAPASALAPGPRIIAVGSGKGGVGKSTLSVNLAVALHRLGLRVGLVDADIHGPSLPRLLGTDQRPMARDNRMIPVPTAAGVPFLSTGLIAEPGQAIAWRGPMASRALEQLITADWSGIDWLVVDLPPGTGDVQLSMIQKHKPVGAVIVSTPQDLALIDARRAVSLFDQVGVPIIGIVENMAGYVCPHCGEVSDPFGSGGAEAEAREAGVPFLGRVPLSHAIRRDSDDGKPPAAAIDTRDVTFAPIAERIAQWIGALPT